MKLLITNVDTPNIPNRIYLIRFNPWGFSRTKIGDQIEESIKSSKIDIDDSCEFYIYIKPLFFGRRGELAYQKIKLLYPKNKIHFIDENCFKSFFNQSAI